LSQIQTESVQPGLLELVHRDVDEETYQNQKWIRFKGD
jgi:hypothetical protein